MSSVLPEGLEVGCGVQGGVERRALSVLMMQILDLDKTQLYLLCDLRKVPNSSSPEFPGLPSGDNNEHVVKIKSKRSNI